MVKKQNIIMKCYLCNNEKHSQVKGTVRDNPDLKFLRCNKCGLIFLNSRDHIDDKFYEKNSMEKSNLSTSIFKTEHFKDTERRYKYFYSILVNKNVLDFGCGEGHFLFKLKTEKIIPYLFALEPNKKNRKFLEENFTLYTDIDDILDDSLDVITLFHVLEHLKDPINVLNILYEKLKLSGKIIIEVPNANDALLNIYDSKEFAKFTYWSCHLYIFNNRTLENLLKNTNYKIVYIKQCQRYTLANHLYWLAKGKPGGHVEWSFLDDDALHLHYEKKLAEIGQCDTNVAIIQK